MKQNITDEELLEELKQRFEQNKQALGELEHLNNELKEVNKKLEESESLKSHFISNITNEIINPFTSILGLSRAILSVDKENWKKVISMVALIHSEAFALDFQFRNIFFAAKLEAGEVSPEVQIVDIKSIAEGVIESFRPEARKQKITIDLSVDSSCRPCSTFRTDAEKTKLILANLLSNAINFSDNDSKVEIQICFDNGTLSIKVKDYGIGISKENQRIIFDRFKRVDSGINSINRGHGLGLSVNKAIVDILNGTIEVESEEGKGTTVTFCIPELEKSTSDFASEANEIFFDGEEETF